MTAKEFFNLTVKVREAQKRYYSIRRENVVDKQRALATSLKLEKELDKAIGTISDYAERMAEMKVNPVFPGFEEEMTKIVTE